MTQKFRITLVTLGFVNPVTECIALQDDDDEKNKGRHNIRKVMTTKKLTTETKTAAKAEKERRERVEEAMKSVSVNSGFCTVSVTSLL